jgi:hypothetical protein
MEDMRKYVCQPGSNFETAISSRLSVLNARNLARDTCPDRVLFYEEETMYAIGQQRNIKRLYVRRPNEKHVGVGWVINEDIDFCMICSKQFGFFLYRHHCRSCGNLVCDPCSPFNLVLQELSDTGEPGPQRVCVQCYWGQEEPLHVARWRANSEFFDEENEVKSDRGISADDSDMKFAVLDTDTDSDTTDQLYGNTRKAADKSETAKNNNNINNNNNNKTNNNGNSSNDNNKAFKTPSNAGSKASSVSPIRGGVADDIDNEYKVSGTISNVARLQLDVTPVNVESEITVVPIPGVCVKTKTNDGFKVFVNVCHHHLVPASVAQKFINNNIDVSQLYVCVGHIRDTADKKGEDSCKLVDVAINSDKFKEYFEDSNRKEKMFLHILKTLESSLGESLDEEYKTPKTPRNYKGGSDVFPIKLPANTNSSGANSSTSPGYIHSADPATTMTKKLTVAESILANESKRPLGGIKGTNPMLASPNNLLSRAKSDAEMKHKLQQQREEEEKRVAAEQAEREKQEAVERSKADKAKKDREEAELAERRLAEQRRLEQTRREEQENLEKLKADRARKDKEAADKNAADLKAAQDKEREFQQQRVREREQKEQREQKERDETQERERERLRQEQAKQAEAESAAAVSAAAKETQRLQEEQQQVKEAEKTKLRTGSMDSRGSLQRISMEKTTNRASVDSVDSDDVRPSRINNSSADNTNGNNTGSGEEGLDSDEEGAAAADGAEEAIDESIKVQPIPGVVLKTKTKKTGVKFFVNLCHHELISPTTLASSSSSSSSSSSASSGLDNLLVVVGDMREVVDKSGESSMLVDCAINTKRFQQYMNDEVTNARDKLCVRVLKSVGKQLNEALDEEYKTPKTKNNYKQASDSAGAVCVMDITAAVSTTTRNSTSRRSVMDLLTGRNSGSAQSSSSLTRTDTSGSVSGIVQGISRQLSGKVGKPNIEVVAGKS